MSENKDQDKIKPSTNDNQDNPKPVDMSKFVPKDELASQLDKIRNDEREKHQRRLEESKVAQDELKAELEALKLSMEKKVNLPEAPKPDLSDSKVLAAMLKELQDESKRRDAERAEEVKSLKELVVGFDQRFADQTKHSEKLVMTAKLDTYRSELIKSSGIMFPELVVGGTVEEIDASVKAVKERETKLTNAGKVEVNKGAAPTPINPGTGKPVKMSLKDSMAIANLSKEDFSKWKAEALKKIRAA